LQIEKLKVNLLEPTAEEIVSAKFFAVVGMQQAEAYQEERVENEHNSYLDSSAYWRYLLRSSPPKKTPKPENKVPASTLKVQVTFN